MYYTLVPSKLARVDKSAPDPEGGQLPAFTHPRSITVSDLVVDMWGEHDDIEHLIDGRIALVQVSPVGEVESPFIDGGGSEFNASGGWLVEAILSLDELLGPEAQRIRQIASTPIGINQESSYADEVEDIQETEEDLDDLVEHAKDALAAADVDGYFWEMQVGCTRGYELIALAAADLTSEDGDWNARAQQQLLRPWATSVRWPLAAA